VFLSKTSGASWHAGIAMVMVFTCDDAPLPAAKTHSSFPALPHDGGVADGDAAARGSLRHRYRNRGDPRRRWQAPAVIAQISRSAVSGSTLTPAQLTIR